MYSIQHVIKVRVTHTAVIVLAAVTAMHLPCAKRILRSFCPDVCCHPMQAPEGFFPLVRRKKNLSYQDPKQIGIFTIDAVVTKKQVQNSTCIDFLESVFLLAHVLGQKKVH